MSTKGSQHSYGPPTLHMIYNPLPYLHEELGSLPRPQQQPLPPLPGRPQAPDDGGQVRHDGVEHELGVLEPEEEEEEGGLGGGREGAVGEAAGQPLGGRVGDLDEDRVAVALLNQESCEFYLLSQFESPRVKSGLIQLFRDSTNLKSKI